MLSFKVDVVWKFTEKGLKPLQVINTGEKYNIKQYKVTESFYPGLSEYAHKNDCLIQYECVLAGAPYTRVLLRYFLDKHMWVMVVI